MPKSEQILNPIITLFKQVNAHQLNIAELCLLRLNF